MSIVSTLDTSYPTVTYWGNIFSIWTGGEAMAQGDVGRGEGNIVSLDYVASYDEGRGHAKRVVRSFAALSIAKYGAEKITLSIINPAAAYMLYNVFGDAIAFFSDEDHHQVLPDLDSAVVMTQQREALWDAVNEEYQAILDPGVHAEVDLNKVLLDETWELPVTD